MKSLLIIFTLMLISLSINNIIIAQNFNKIMKDIDIVEDSLQMGRGEFQTIEQYAQQEKRLNKKLNKLLSQTYKFDINFNFSRYSIKSHLLRVNGDDNIIKFGSGQTRSIDFENDVIFKLEPAIAKKIKTASKSNRNEPISSADIWIEGRYDKWYKRFYINSASIELNDKIYEPDSKSTGLQLVNKIYQFPSIDRHRTKVSKNMKYVIDGKTLYKTKDLLPLYKYSKDKLKERKLMDNIQYSANFSPNEKYLSTVYLNDTFGSEQKVYLIDLNKNTSKILFSNEFNGFGQTKKYYRANKFSTNNKFLAFIGYIKTDETGSLKESGRYIQRLIIWDVKNNRKILSRKIYYPEIFYKLSFTPNDKGLVIASNSTLMHYKISSSATQSINLKHNKTIDQTDFEAFLPTVESKNLQYYGGYNISKFSNGEIIRKLEKKSIMFHGGSRFPEPNFVSPDGKLLASEITTKQFGEDRGIVFWSTENGNVIRVLKRVDPVKPGFIDNNTFLIREKGDLYKLLIRKRIK